MNKDIKIEDYIKASVTCGGYRRFAAARQRMYRALTAAASCPFDDALRKEAERETTER